MHPELSISMQEDMLSIQCPLGEASQQILEQVTSYVFSQ